MTTKITLNNIADTALATLTGPKVTTIVYPGTETATDVAGGATINLTGAGFQSGCSVLVASTASSVVTFISSTQISFIAPALAAGTYVIYVINPDGGTAISIPGVSYSGTPNWTTTAGSLGNAYETGAISATLTATGDAPITYTLASGTLPTGSTLASNGTLSGTAVATASATTYSFTVSANDAQNQTTNRSFSLTINPDVVTWVSPADSTTYTVAKDTAISNVTMSATSAAGGSITYTADTLPTGLSITGANIAGTPTVSANTTTVLTATSTATRTATKTINWVVNVGNDPYFEYTTLLLQGASTTFVDDASTNNFAVTINGDTKPNSFNPYTPGYYSNYFDGSGDGLSVAAGNTALSFGTGDYTVEFWVYPVVFGSVSNSAPTMVAVHDGSTDSGWQLYWNDGQIGIRTHYSNVVYWTASMSSYLNVWSHVAYVRSGGTQKIYVNGIERCSTSTVWNWTDTTLQIATAAQDFNGYISNLRLVKGTALYTSAFTPPSAPLTAVSGTSVLTCQSNRFIDNSTNAFTIISRSGGNQSVKSFDPFTPNTSYSTYGSAYFDGTGDYLTVPNNSALSLGSGAFTVEIWLYILAYNASTSRIIDWRSNGGAPSNIPVITLSSSGAPIFYADVATGALITGSSAIALNTWAHLAVVRSDSTVTMYLNGTSIGSASSSLNLGVETLNLNDPAAGSTYGQRGYFSDLRIVKGTAVYTSAFTPPTSPLTAIANTSLLTLQNNQPVNNSTFLDNSTNNFFVTRNGNATQGTFSPYGGNWSNYFDGTGDYVRKAGSGVLTASGDVTIECWIYPLSSTVVGLFDGGTGEGDIIRNWGNNIISKQAQHGTGAVFTVTVNTWQHFACTFTGGNIKVFINGTLNASGTYTGGYAAGSNFDIGTINGGGDGSFNGYISNFRVSTSVVYTANFTPSTTPLTPLATTTLLTCQSNRLIDNSMRNVTLTKGGDTSVQRFSPFNPASVTPASYSAYFDGSGDYMNVPQSTGFALGTGDFTIECWVYYIPGGSGDRFILDNGNGNFLLRYAAGATLQFYAQSNLRLTYAVTLANAWYHLAVVHSGTTYTLYVNGVAVNTSTGSDNITNSSAIGIGAISGGNGDYFSGHISNVRIVKGVAVYTGAFTVPTTPLTATQSSGTNIVAITGTATSVLTCQSSTFIDNSTNNFAITGGGDSRPVTQNPFGYTSTTTNGYTVSTIGGSGYFDGSGDYITVPNDTNINLGSANFTIEMWVYLTSSNGNFTLFQKPSSYELKVDSSRWVWQINANNNIFVANGTLANNTWTHVAMVRNGATSTLYLNGAAYASGTSADATTNTNALIVGSGSAAFGGYISDFRIIKGTAVYKSNFLPPAAPLTAVQNTTFLANMTDAGIYDSSTMNNLETVGDVKLSTSISKFGGTSMYFDGTTDYVVQTTNLNFGYGTSDFTIEFWLYLNTVSADQTIISNLSSVSSVNPHIYYGNNLGIRYYTNNGDRITGSALSPSTWYHIAVCRASGSTKMFINGTQTGSTYADSNNYGTSAPLGIGTYWASGSPSTVSTLNGYLDDLRITKGYARYTSNFTAPTSEFKTF